LASRLPRTVPAVRLGRLAVDISVQGQGLGEHLLIDAMRRTREVLRHIGVNVLLVDAKDEKAAAFYRKYGFRAFPGNPLQLVIPLANLPF
jgi:ribosomal protein S18 acetylase RimI-like enzyme